LISLRLFGPAINRNEIRAPIECHGAGHSRLHLILLRAMPGVILARGMAGRRSILARLHDAARKTSGISKHQSNGEQD
jgi:hypothetical protein